MTSQRRVVVEADGGSRGNPGPAGYGAVLKDADTGAVIAEAAESIGRATNNVAEYRGLIAGLELYADHTPDALLEVRMDSKLVIEQMAGRWKIKHPDMRPLAVAAQRLAPVGTTWTWIPRARNAHADRLANLAMDAAARGEVFDTAAAAPDPPPAPSATHPLLGWSGLDGDPTRLIFLRHGETAHTVARRFSGSGGDDPGLLPSGLEQAVRAAEALSRAGEVDLVVSSPLRRTLETAEQVSRRLDLPVTVEPGFQECAFGDWDGLTLAEARTSWPREVDGWLGDTSVAPPGGEAVTDVRARVEATLTSTLERHAEKTIVVVSHVTPIKLSVRLALQAPWEVTHRMLLAPGSLTTVWFYGGGGDGVLRSFSVTP